MKRIVATGALLLICAALSGCGATAGGAELQQNTRLQENQVTLEDGRTVTCIVHWRNGGISCDW